MAQDDEPLAFPFPPASTLYEPSPVYEELRAERPLVRIATPDGNSAWLVTRYDDVREVLTDGRFSRARAAGPGIPVAGLARLAGESMLGMDPPEHSRLRKLVARAFTVRRVEELRPRVVSLVDELLEGVKRLPQPADLVDNFCIPLPIHVICELLGVPREDRHFLHDWSDTVMGDWAQDVSELDRVLESLNDYFDQLFTTKRKEPADDLMSALIAARDEQDKLSERELTSLCLGLLIAGHETSVSQIGMSLVTLLHHREQFEAVRADPELVPKAIEELLRFTQISAGGGTLPRVTTQDLDLAGCPLPEGSVVMQATNSGNRDAHKFDRADELDISRGVKDHLTFGAGMHTCLGAPLARMELQESLRGVLRHMPDIRVAVPDSELEFKRGMFIRSLNALPVTW